MANLDMARGQTRENKIRLHGTDAFEGMRRAGLIGPQQVDSYPPWRGTCVAVPRRRGSSSHGVGLHLAAFASFLKFELT